MTDCIASKMAYHFTILDRVFLRLADYEAWLEAQTYKRAPTPEVIADRLAIRVSLHVQGGLVTREQAQQWMTADDKRILATIRHIEDHTLCKNST